MDAWILDTQFRNVMYIDTFESFIWNERYFGYGEFELYMLVSNFLLNNIRQGYYVILPDSEYVMIIEDIEITTKVEEGDHLKISGRSLESILDRRIIWAQTVINGNLQNGIRKLLLENAISPADSSRTIPGLIFEYSTDPAITSLSLRAQYTGDNLYETIEAICLDNNLGFKVTLNSNNQFVFKLYAGVDRSYDQLVNPYVIFSPQFDNLLGTNYMESGKALKNVTLVAGEDEGNTRRTITVGNEVGLNRRELYTDARDIQSEVGEETISDEEYYAQLTQRGREKLAQHKATKEFEGEVDASRMFIYGEDFLKGDIVEIVNEYGMEAKARVVEVIRSQDLNGYSMYPGFTIIDEE